MQAQNLRDEEKRASRLWAGNARPQTYTKLDPAHTAGVKQTTGLPHSDGHEEPLPYEDLDCSSCYVFIAVGSGQGDRVEAYAQGW